MMNKKIKRSIHWLLFAIIIAYIVTGLGITYYRTVEDVTLGILTKNTSFSLHEYMLLPMLLLLALHVAVSTGILK